MKGKEIIDGKSATVQELCSNALLNMFSVLATKKANSLCSCFMYEPKVPKKLKNK